MPYLLKAIAIFKRCFLRKNGLLQAKAMILNSDFRSCWRNYYFVWRNRSSLYRLYNDSASSITSLMQTALLPMGDPIRTKQALKFAD